MKFHKMLKKMLKNPRVRFGSLSLRMHQQSLHSIRYWFCEDNDGNAPEESAKLRKKAFLRIIKATDWEIE